MKIQKNINQINWKELNSFMHEDFVSRSWTEEENDDPNDKRWSKADGYST